MKSGETVAIVAPEGANPIIVEAIHRALLERKIRSVLLYDYDLVGVSNAGCGSAKQLQAILDRPSRLCGSQVPLV